VPRVTRKTAKLSEHDMQPGPASRAAAIVVIQGAAADIGVHRVVDGEPCIVGRGPGADLALLDDWLSRRHYVIIPREAGVVVEDLGSTNGTLLNGVPLVQPTRLKDGDHIAAGETVVKFAAGASFELRYHASMDQRVGTDELTGLVARHRFEGALTQALEAVAVESSTLGVLMLDLDGVKQINDTHGHLFGAHAIAEAGRIIGRTITSHGLASRLGGDEFAAFLPHLDREGTVELAHTIVSLVEAHRFEKEMIEVRPSISVGVSLFPDDGVTPEVLMRRADEALYRAKRAGKNRVSL
jgi:two-component system, cell cycle response regulator